MSAQPNSQANWPTISTFQNAELDLRATLPTISTLENSSVDISTMVSSKNCSSNWSDAKIGFLKCVGRDHHPISKRHNSSNWKSIVCELNKLLREQGIGSIHTGNQCKAKIQNLEDKYKHNKDQDNKSGYDHKTFTYYKEFNKILGSHPKITPKSIIDCGFEDRSLSMNISLSYSSRKSAIPQKVNHI